MLVLRLFGTTSRCMSIQPLQLLPSRNIWRHISLIWPFSNRHRHAWWPVDVTELFHRLWCWRLIRLSPHLAWLCREYWGYRNLIDWLIHLLQRKDCQAGDWPHNLLKDRHVTKPKRTPVTEHPTILSPSKSAFVPEHWASSAEGSGIILMQTKSLSLTQHRILGIGRFHHFGRKCCRGENCPAGVEPTTFWPKNRHATNFAKELSPLTRAVITQASHRTPDSTLYISALGDRGGMSTQTMFSRNLRFKVWAKF